MPFTPVPLIASTYRLRSAENKILPCPVTASENHDLGYNQTERRLPSLLNLLAEPAGKKRQTERIAMSREKIISAISEVGCDEYREIATGDIVFSREVLEQCSRNTCGNYGRNYGCPPHSGSIEEIKARIFRCSKAFLVSKIVSIVSDNGDDPLKIVDRTIKKLRRFLANSDVLILGAGPCTKCRVCAAVEGNPCRFPGEIQYSLEGSGIDVVRMSLNLKMTYNAGGGRVAFFILILYNE